MINYSPQVGEDEVVECNTKIIFEFNWDVDVESAIAAFSITPEVKGSIVFEDSQHRMIFLRINLMRFRRCIRLNWIKV